MNWHVKTKTTNAHRARLVNSEVLFGNSPEGCPFELTAIRLRGDSIADIEAQGAHAFSVVLCDIVCETQRLELEVDEARRAVGAEYRQQAHERDHDTDLHRPWWSLIKLLVIQPVDRNVRQHESG